MDALQEAHEQLRIFLEKLKRNDHDVWSLDACTAYTAIAQAEALTRIAEALVAERAEVRADTESLREGIVNHESRVYAQGFADGLSAAPHWEPVEQMDWQGAMDDVRVVGGKLHVWLASAGAPPAVVELPDGCALCRRIDPDEGESE